MMNDFCPLGDIDQNTSLWGGKAVALSTLHRHGFDVPDGFVISSNIYKSYLRHTLDSDAFQRSLFRMCNSMFGNTHNLIFRSSANVEGSDRLNCCGVFDSIICNQMISFPETVEHVWKSVFNTRAKAFYELTGVSENDVTMSVLVQKIHIEKYSAVIQTSDIIHSKRRIVLEYLEGDVSAVVEGIKDAKIAYIENPSDATQDIPEKLVAKLISDCRIAESIFGCPLELEAQIGTDKICYLQARKLV